MVDWIQTDREGREEQRGAVGGRGREETETALSYTNSENFMPSDAINVQQCLV